MKLTMNIILTVADAAFNYAAAAAIANNEFGDWLSNELPMPELKQGRVTNVACSQLIQLFHKNE